MPTPRAARQPSALAPAAELVVEAYQRGHVRLTGSPSVTASSHDVLEALAWLGAEGAAAAGLERGAPPEARAAVLARVVEDAVATWPVGGGDGGPSRPRTLDWLCSPRGGYGTLRRQLARAGGVGATPPPAGGPRTGGPQGDRRLAALVALARARRPVEQRARAEEILAEYGEGLRGYLERELPDAWSELAEVPPDEAAAGLRTLVDRLRESVSVGDDDAPALSSHRPRRHHAPAAAGGNGALRAAPTTEEDPP